MADPRQTLRAGLARLLADPAAAPDILAPEAVWDVGAPVDRVEGRDAVAATVLEPLRAALAHVHRRDEIVIGGENRRDEGGTWVACVTHYVGTHVGPLWGVAPSGRLAMLRAGEFHRVEADGRISAARIILDLPDLMLQGGRNPFGRSLGAELTFPPPATQDGVCPAPEGGAESLRVVEGMLADLHVFDPATVDSPNQTGPTGWWAEDMLWWGPAGIGSNFRWEGFVRDHRAPFLHAFPDRKGGDHYARVGDGAFAAVSGWPSMTMTHRGDYLGTPATGRALTLRVMDFYRIAGGRVAENWVMLDLVDLFHQMGTDLLAPLPG
jgi:predicted ester cyclase